MKKSNPTKLLFIFGCVFTGIALAAFVVFSAIFIKGMDGTNYVLEGIKAILSTFTSLFGGAAKGSVYTYAVIGVGGLATLMTVYFTVLFATAKKGKSIVATLLAFVSVVIICLAGEAFIFTYISKVKIGMRVTGGIFASVMPALLGLVSFLVYDVVSFVDVAAPAPVKKEDTKALEERCDDLQKQIDELKKALEEKADAKEEVVEEVKEEPAPAVVEEVKEEPAPAPVVEEKEEEVVPDQVTVVDEATGVAYLVRYNKSYTAKLALAKDEVQGWYNEVKNYLLSYGANSRVSWNYDAFNIGRKAVAKLNITGKTLSIYIALEPAEYVDSKYHAKDVSSSKKYEQTPTSMKIKSDRGVKFAKELIDILMASMGQERKEKEAEDFTEAKRTLEELLAEGLVKETKTAMSAPVAAPAEEVKEEVAPAPVEEEGEVVEVEAVEEPEEVETEEEAAEEEKADAAKKEKTIYHVSKREGDDGREWKVFKQGSKKVIKLFDTQAEALEYAKTLAKNKDDGSTVLLHGLDGKIRKY